MGIFQEYMNSKGKVVEKGKVDISGDNTDPKTPPTKPPGDNGQKPYTSSDGKKKKGKEKGFGDEGDKDLVFDYETEKSDGKKAAKIPTAEQRFAHLEVVPLVCESLSRDPLIVENMVREIKQNGLLHILVAELMEHRETYRHLASLMKDETYGPEICRKLKRSMNEEVAAPFHSQMLDDDPEDLEAPEEDELGIDGIGADDEFSDLEGDDLGLGGDELGLDGELDDELGLGGDELGLDDELGGEFDDEFGLEDEPSPMSDVEMMQMMRRMMGKA